MAIRFEWDPRKAMSNAGKHRVTFQEAATVFGDRRSVTIYDPERSMNEDRFVTVGMSSMGRLLVVVHTERGVEDDEEPQNADEVIQIVTARRATSKEAIQYAQA